MAFSTEELQKWNVDALRRFLSERGVPLGGGTRKEELVKKCLFAQELQLPVLPNVEKRAKEITNRRAEKLKVDHIQIPLPEQIVTGWLKGSWYVPNVTTVSLQEYAKKSIANKALNEGLNLHNSRHISNVEFNNISDCVRYCFIKAQCVPQTRISEAPYNVWVCINTQTCDVLTGECNCIAGYSESCKHLFALLHFIASEVALGHNKTCTSKQQQWGRKVKKNEKIHPPTRLENITFKRPHPEYEEDYSKPSRCTFDPRPPHDRVSDIDWNKLSEASEGKASVLCFKRLHAYNDHGTYVNIVNDEPKTVDELVLKASNEKTFLTLLKCNRTNEDIEKIAKLTNGQSTSQLWFSFRRGVITASVSHNVSKKLRTPKSTNQLVAKILGYTKNVKSASLSWGIQNEMFARKRYIRQERKKHKHFKCVETGLKIHPEKPFIGASVDGVISCSCCGMGNVEIKCPFTHREKKIAEYARQPGSCIQLLSTEDGQTSYNLRVNHPYHTQVQHQMFVTGAKYADFVVFLPKESCTIRIHHDKEFMNNLLPLLGSFYSTYVIPELLKRELAHEFIAKNVLDDLVYNVVTNVDAELAQKKLDLLLLSPPAPPSISTPQKKKKTK